METNWLVEAVSNNAAWCDAVATSHGIPTCWHDSIWFSKHPTPPLYPNIVTLKSGVLIDEEIDSTRTELSTGWAIKDSFSELSLEDNNFSVAFDAHWYCRIPEQGVTDKKNINIHVDTVTSEFELNRWIAAWGEGNDIFVSTLLENTSVELIYVERNGKVVSGLATNLTGNSVGISNAYGQANDIADCVTSII